MAKPCVTTASSMVLPNFDLDSPKRGDEEERPPQTGVASPRASLTRRPGLRNPVQPGPRKEESLLWFNYIRARMLNPRLRASSAHLPVPTRRMN